MRASLTRMFCRYVLRTTDADAGRRFYSEAIGLELPIGAAAGSSLESWPLHEQALARGAPAHWLGQIAVADTEATAERLVTLGAERLGPTVQARDASTFATLRDPFGAVVGVRSGTAQPTKSPVVWHQLHTRDADRAERLYGDLLGWVRERTVEMTELEGGYRMFAFRAGNAVAGAIANTARWPGVHSHWLFHFPVSDIEAATKRVRALGGTAFDPIQLPDGLRLAACEDPQGAAFGLAAPP